jgi:saccharopine dehydrogenase-like NADP-dependent oxidoreductase
MKKILLLGAGMVARPLAEYLLNHNFNLTIASRTLSKAEKLIGEKPNGKALLWTTDDWEMLNKLIADHDLVVSLLPHKHHVTVAQLCIKHQKHLVTTSYVSAEMKELDQEAKTAGVLLLNEMGVDPGFDHMTAKRIIDKVHAGGGKIKTFYSLCGALVAPEEAGNPFRYQFSWSPKGVIMAANNGAKFLKDGNIVDVPADNMFKNPLLVGFPEVGKMEVYPNRNSLAYIPVYGLTEVENLYRGTFRYPDWCEIMDAIKTLGLICYDKRNFEGKTYSEVVAEKMGVYPRNVKEKVAEKLHLEINSPAIVAMDWLGLFSKERVQIKEGSTFELTTDLMQKKMMLPEGARDMVLMFHSFLVEKASGDKEVIHSRLLRFGNEKNTAVARTVALPAAIAAKLILENRIHETGVVIPVSKTIYEPVLKEMEMLGISTTEEWGLPEKETIG